jgi:hypothetical protein
MPLYLFMARRLAFRTRVFDIPQRAESRQRQRELAFDPPINVPDNDFRNELFDAIIFFGRPAVGFLI